MVSRKNLSAGYIECPKSLLLLAKPVSQACMFRFSEMETGGVHPVLIAAYLHDELVRIHPFIDGNGRTSRLLMNLYLLRNGYLIVNLKGSDEAKLAYYKALEALHIEKRPEAFQTLVAEMEKESLNRYLSILGDTEADRKGGR